MQLTLTIAMKLLAIGMARAADIKAPSTIAIVDSGGHLIVKVRMDGALLVTLRMAEDKAYTSLAVGEPTSGLLAQVQPGREMFGLFAVEAGRMIVYGGGAPLFAGQELLGGVGVAGGTAEQDVSIADAMLAEWAGVIRSYGTHA